MPHCIASHRIVADIQGAEQDQLEGFASLNTRTSSIWRMLATFCVCSSGFCARPNLLENDDFFYFTWNMAFGPLGFAFAGVVVGLRSKQDIAQDISV